MCQSDDPLSFSEVRKEVQRSSAISEVELVNGISILLACSFFIGSSVTFLALLSRLRVLIQQILLDAVSVFNLVTSTSLEKQSVKIAHDGVFREFYPEDEECTTTFLYCVWKTDKYVLLETLQTSVSLLGGKNLLRITVSLGIFGSLENMLVMYLKPIH
ncbi:hypothetical protein F2Q69_00042398 [Brassica cretica]|uniref:Uncharacterized protein n=1 Tax=Brassica cretica TaxID=69181 RepID=A0A8S9NBT4_BRACR|nr:hypothetical protein F2Q69_00042398 [Brassica cretica]